MLLKPQACALLLAALCACLSADAAPARTQSKPQAQQQAPRRGFKIDGQSRLNHEVRVLLTGDSLMYALGPQLQKCLAGYEGLTLIPIGKSSSGLSRPDFYNWPEVLEKHLVEDKPNVVVMWIGTNDSVKIYQKEYLGEPCTQAWSKEYAQKMMEIVKLTRKYNARLVWMGPPVMDRPKFDGHLQYINSLMKWVASKSDSHFVNTRPILADAKGVYIHAAQMPDGSVEPLRTHDHIHITEAGNRLVMERLLPVLTVACEEAVYGKRAGASSAPKKGAGNVSGRRTGSPATTAAPGLRRRGGK